MNQQTIQSDLAADIELLRWKPALSPRATALRSLNIAVSAALLASGSAVFAQRSPAPWQSGNGFRYAEIALPKSAKTGFVKLDAASIGITFTNLLSPARSMTNSPLNNGSGIAAGDVDGDGWCDLYFCGLENANALYRNLGNGQFRDISAQAGVACAGQFSTGAVFADLDGDGDLDLAVNALGGGTRLFLNDGSGHFTEVTQQVGLASRAASMALAVADYDGDGNLDIYVSNYRSKVLMDEPDTKFTVKLVDGKPEIVKVNGLPVTAPGLVGRFSISPSGGPRENGEADVLYHNDGKGHFVPVSWIDGTFLDEDGNPLSTPPYDWGLGVIFRDLNGDGAPDLYVCNDSHSPDRIWINLGRGRFQAIARTAIRKTSLSSMGVDVADINRDGFDDIFVLDMFSRDHQKRLTQKEGVKPPTLHVGQSDDRPQYPRNTLFLNRGDGTYAEIAEFSGLEASEWSWTPVFLDVDLDGFEDLLISNGFLFDVRDADANQRINVLKAEKKLSSVEQLFLRKLFPNYATSQKVYRNRGDSTFEDRSREWGFAEVGVSQGMCLADLDNDGDLDVVVNTLNGPAQIYRNESSAPRVAVRLKGLPPNTRGIGAKVWLYGGAVPMQSQEMICGGRYLSSDDAMRVFAAGSLTNEMRIEVKWRSGKRSVVNGVLANRIYEIDEARAGEGGASERQSVRALKQNSRVQDSENHAPRSTLHALPLFEDVSVLLQHNHHEDPFDDFARQPLLPNKLSQLGPGVSWFDVDGDGWEDLMIGSGKGGTLAVYRNDGQGGFQRLSGFEQAVTRDQSGILGWRGSGGTVILA